MEPLVRCGGCGEPPADKVLRRGRCSRCYDAWVKSRPVGLGAHCGSCEDRRVAHLRHFELGLRANVPGGRWVVLCHNCATVAEKMTPPPRSIEALKMHLSRDRRWPGRDRRTELLPGEKPSRHEAFERRLVDRRRSDRGAEFLEGEVIEMEADFEEVSDDQIEASEEVTGIHLRIPLPE